MIISNESELDFLNDNYFVGTKPVFRNTKIIFNGHNNVFYCDKGVVLENCYFSFGGNNSLIYLSKNINTYKLSVTVYNDSVCYFGENNYFNSVLNIMISERKHVFFGSDSIIAYGVQIRTADPHLIYDVTSLKRINPSKSVFVGDHVWIGQDSLLLKGTKIDSGSIIAARSVVCNEINSNSCWGGVTAKQLKKDIFWDGNVVHNYTSDRTEESLSYAIFSQKYPLKTVDSYIFKYDDKNQVGFDYLDDKLSSIKSALEKVDFLRTISTSKNRFVHLH